MSSAGASGIGDIWFAAVGRCRHRAIIDRRFAMQPMFDVPGNGRNNRGISATKF